MSGAWATHEPWRMMATLLTHLAFMVSVYTVVLLARRDVETRAVAGRRLAVMYAMLYGIVAMMDTTIEAFGTEETRMAWPWVRRAGVRVWVSVGHTWIAWGVWRGGRN